MAEAAAAPEGSHDAPPKESKLPVLMALLNVVGAMAVIGSLVYTRILYKRPQITEELEREVVATKFAKAKHADNSLKALIKVEAFTANIKTGDGPIQSPGAPAAIGKMHYVNMAFSLEVRDGFQAEVDSIRAPFMDKLLHILGKMTVEELTTVQGRYILRTQIVDLVNQLLNKGKKDAEPVATNVYFSQFLVQ